MGFFNSITKSVEDIYKAVNPENILSELDRTILGSFEEPTLQDPTFDPFAVDNRSIIGASEALRKRLANKRGLSSTDITGGVRSTATGLKPTLFTFN